MNGGSIANAFIDESIDNDLSALHQESATRRQN
jgi:hypothetical protein